MTSPTSSRRQRSNRGGGSGGAMRKHAERELARRAMALLLVVAGAAAALFLLTGDAAASTAPAASAAPGSCANGTVVPQPAANPELVADCRVLLDLQPTLAGTATLNWGANTALSSWDGITVASLDGIQRVTELDMDGQGLNGTIPAQLGQLSGLRELRLAWGNQLTGSIPAGTGTADPPHLPQPGRQPSVRSDPARARLDRPATHPSGPQRTAALAERSRPDWLDPGATWQPLRSDIPLPRRQSSDRVNPATTRPAAQAELVALDAEPAHRARSRLNWVRSPT